MGTSGSTKSTLGDRGSRSPALSVMVVGLLACVPPTRRARAIRSRRDPGPGGSTGRWCFPGAPTVTEAFCRDYSARIVIMGSTRVAGGSQ